MLKDKYDDPEKISDMHLKAIQNLPSIMRVNAKDLRNFYENLEKHLRNLQQGDQHFEIGRNHLIKPLLAKLPVTVQKEMFTRGGDKITTSINQFREELHQIVKLQEKLQFEERPKPERRPSLQTTEVRRKGNGGNPNGGTLRRDPTKRSQDQTQRRCRFCKVVGHSSFRCQKFKTCDERKKALGDNFCHNCLGSNHQIKDCKFRKNTCFICGGAHANALCPKHDFTKPAPQKHNGAASPQGVMIRQPELIHGDCPYEGESYAYKLPEDYGETMMQVAIAHIQSPTYPHNVKQVTVLVDTGGSNTYLTIAAAQELGLELTNPQVCQVAAFGTEKPTWLRKYKVNFELMLKLAPKSITSNNHSVNAPIMAQAVKDICPIIDVPGIDLSENDLTQLRKIHTELADQTFYKSKRLKIDLLLANDYYPYFLLNDSFQLEKSKVFLIKTALGWVSAGRITEAALNTQKRSATVLFNAELAQTKLALDDETVEVPSKRVPIEVEDDKFILDLEETWRKEMLDGRPSSVVSAEEDQKAEEIIENAYTMKDGRVSVPWPYKEGLDVMLKPNYYLSLRRLSGALRRLSPTPELLMKYHDYFGELNAKDIIEEVLADSYVGPRIYYIPHHAVFTPLKTTTKMRIVFDASSHESIDSLSLNECLYRGPVYLPSIVGVLLRFRSKPVAIVSDIEKAFLMVDLQLQDRDVTRFLWIKDPTKPFVEGNLKIYRFTRIPFGVISSPFLLSFSVRCLLKGMWSEVAELIQANIYVDNVIVAVDSVEKAKELYKESKAIFQSGKMNLREWGSNSKEFMNSVPEHDHAKEADIIKVLGVSWNTDEDTFFITGPDVETLQKATSKRQILKYIQKIFDPLGMAHPICIMGKIFLQRVWKQDYKWDQTLSPELQTQWITIASMYSQIYTVKIPRVLFTGEIKSAHLLCFTDASPDAYTALIYLRVQTETTCTCNLLYSKARVCPTAKGPSIPRLELQGLVVGLEMVSAVVKEVTFPVNGICIFTDSNCVLRWTSYEQEQREKLTIFVANRLRKILQMMTVLPNPVINHVASQDNPADLATKLRPESYKVPWNFWFHGPDWILNPIEKWPCNDHKLDEPTVEEEEIMLKESKKGISRTSTALVQGSIQKPLDINLDEIIPAKNFSSLFKLYRVTAYVNRFVTKLKERIKKAPSVPIPKLNKNEKWELMPQDIRKAKRMWDLSVQHEHYSDILENRMSAEHQNLARQLNLYVDSDTGLIKGRGRLAQSKHVQSTKLLPHQSHLSYLIVKNYHEFLHHGSATHTLAVIRKEYWIPQLNRLINKAILACMVCRKLKALPYRLPIMADLPRTRVNQVAPFKNIGVALWSIPLSWI